MMTEQATGFSICEQRNEAVLVDRAFSSNQWLLKAGPKEVVVFDLDGTLINSDYANFLAYKSALEKIVGPQPSLVFDSCNRLTRQSLQAMMPLISNDQLADVIAEKERLYPMYLSVTTVNEAVVDVLRDSADLGKQVILATNSKQDRAERLLDHHGLLRHFTNVYFNGEIKAHNKYQNTLRGLPTGPQSILVFENECYEAKMAHAAGVGIEDIILVKGE